MQSGARIGKPAKVGALLLAMAAVVLLPVAPLAGQVVEGVVVDARTEEPVPTARVSLVSADGEHVETVLTDPSGWFILRPGAPGRYRLEAGRLGYAMQRTDPFDVAADAITRRDLHLTTRAVEVEGIVVEGYAGRLMHDATLSGVFTRRARSPSVGGNRVLVRGDPEFDRSHTVWDLIRGKMPRPACPRVNREGKRVPFVFRDGWEAADAVGPGDGEFQAETFILDLPIREVQAVEYYRSESTIPASLRPWTRGHIPGTAKDIVRHCGVVAVWSHGAPR